MFIPLKIVERGRKSLIRTDPHASEAIPLWRFPLENEKLGGGLLLLTGGPGRSGKAQSRGSLTTRAELGH